MKGDNEQMPANMRHTFMDSSRGHGTIMDQVPPSINILKLKSLWELSCYTGEKEWEGKNTRFNYVYLKKSEK